MNTFSRLRLHLERHMYKRGRNKGEAPADASRRSKTHFRVLTQGNTMVVRMHGTNILTAFEDGSIKVSTGGWWTSTTKSNLNYALRNFVPQYIGVGTRLAFSMRQPVIVANQKTYRFYDGIEFDVEGNLTSTPLCFERKRKDKDETAEFRKDIAESGFKDMFPILYQSAEVPERTWLRHNIPKTMASDAHVNDWPTVAALVKYPDYRSRTLNRPKHADWRDAWKSLMATATVNMTEVVLTNVITL